MELSLQQLRQGLRDGTLAFCMPAAHAELSSDFLEDFSERILKQDWREVSMHAHNALSELLADEDSETDLVASIELNYHIDLSGLAELTLWEVMRWCAGANRKS
jgi:hypothetical protein